MGPPAVAVAVAASLAVLSGTAEASERRVAVVTSAAINLDETEARELSDRIAFAIEEELEVEVVGGSYVAGRLPPDVLPDCPARERCVAQVLDALEASELLFVVLTRVGDEVEIETTWARRGAAARSRPSLELAVGGAGWTGALRRHAPSLLPAASRRRRLILSTPVASQERRRKLGHGFWAATTIGGVALVGATSVALLARRDYEGLADDGCDGGGCPEERVDRLESRARTADALFAVSAIAGLTALYFYATADEESPRLGVTPSSDGASVWIGGAL